MKFRRVKKPLSKLVLKLKKGLTISSFELWIINIIGLLLLFKKSKNVKIFCFRTLDKEQPK